MVPISDVRLVKTLDEKALHALFAQINLQIVIPFVFRGTERSMADDLSFESVGAGG